MTMIVVNIHEIKAKLSEYLEAAVGGERVVICKRNRPVAELQAVKALRTSPRPVGGAKGKIKIPRSFFEPMSDKWLDDVESGLIFPAPLATPPRAAETATTYGRRKARTPRRSPRR